MTAKRDPSTWGMPPRQDPRAGGEIDTDQIVRVWIAVLGQLGKAEVAFLGPVEQGANRRGLKQHVVVPLGMEVLLAHRLHVQGFDPTLVEHAAQSFTAAGGPRRRP